MYDMKTMEKHKLYVRPDFVACSLDGEWLICYSDIDASEITYDDYYENVFSD